MDVKTAGRTLDVFEAFARDGRPASVTELARTLEIPVSSCFSLLRTLEARGYLYSLRDRGPLFPTGRLMQLATAISAHDPLLQRLVDLTRSLSDEFDETAVLGTLRGASVVYLHSAESARPIRYAPAMGTLRAAHANSIGKALLASLGTAQLSQMLSRLSFESFTPRTLTSQEAFLADLEAGRKRGWHFNLGESVEDLGAVACTVSANGYTYGISIAGPLARIVAVGPEKIGRRLAERCAEVAGSLQQ